MNALVLITLVAFLGSIQAATQATRFVSCENLQPANGVGLAGRPGARDFHLGFKQPNSVLARSLIVHSADDAYVADIFTAGQIIFVEARDQTNGTGGYVRYYAGGIRDSFVQLHFRAVANASSDTYFVIDVWTDPTPYEPAAGFQRGELTERSQLDYVTDLVYEANNISWSGGLHLYDDDLIKFTFIETFDLSEDQNGGFVAMQDEFGNSSAFTMMYRSVAPHMPMNVSVAVYSELRENGGANFRLGRYVPGIALLLKTSLKVAAIEGDIVRGTVNIVQNNKTIVFVQAKDRVPNGTGQLVDIVSGGVGSNKMTLVIDSGVGEPLDFEFEIFGMEED